MKVYVIAFTKKGTELAETISNKLEHFECFSMKVARDGITMVYSLAEWTQKAFEQSQGIVFVGACGIAVRAIAPHIKDKYQDPAVVVADEKGEFIISLLSGHMGQANALTQKIAKAIHATPVITTATDVNGVFAVDTWIKQNGFICLYAEQSKSLLKQISATLLEDKTIAFDSIFYYDKLPKGLTAAKHGEIGICLSVYRHNKLFQQTLYLIAPVLHMGIGCKKNTSFQQIEQAVFEILEEENIAIEAIKAVATIDLKQYEKGILLFCEQYQKQFYTFSAEQLSNVKGNISHSDFVEQITGVDNVCERAAICSAQNSNIIVNKRVKNGVTIAFAMETIQISF
ncbi:cobalamin biosynthesis protein [Lachnospiraceae bacterium 46-61]